MFLPRPFFLGPEDFFPPFLAFFFNVLFFGFLMVGALCLGLSSSITRGLITSLMYRAMRPNIAKSCLSELFSLVQTKNPLQETDIDAFLKEHNLVKQEDLTQSQQQQWAKFMEDAVTKTEQASISSIPSFIINGRYMVKLRGHRSMEELLETIQYLKEQ